MSAAGLEVAADSIGSAVAAQQGGAMRVELCGGLDGGGLTPSFGTLAVVRERLQIPLYVLIRPRVGDFVFNADEVEVMRRDVEQCVRIGCDGVVLGALDRDGQVDLATMRVLIAAAGTLGVTFHRAIDVSADPLRALDAAIALGCERVLTSGARASAIDGIETIAAMTERAAGRIVVMPGAGVSEHNMAALRAGTGAREFHASLRGPVAAQVHAPHAHISDLGGDYQRTDVARVRRFVELLHR
ncbi:copper homeostasis protein CutC [Xanthomonas cannabis]|uniref:copper homeostasis protein CutC n=1 Tax=Xanthomonas cannabis TaxID=1885674 RepID=UPI0005730862|nr:copper homeostasis protein CutC [Xanthomonas cannabis]KHL56257.1 copper homeostasis protein CutC [Xanthomonas cannabis pv. cannabis]KHL57356.1 copper homeostasis protein CutC [Xanthomonas cannabis pv. cannabis]MCC8442092.1 copper homeostasis protein CutC [Xanthomonas cannabis]